MGQAIMKFGRTKQSEAAASGSVGTTNITNVSASASAATGSQPTVSASLSDTSLSFAFGLVPGETGPQGETGPIGPTGNGISGIALISTVGKVKTYRITFTDGSTFDYTVTDGADGTGAGDMTKAVYDTDDDGFVDAVEDTLNPGTGIEFSLDSDGKGQYRATGASQWIPFLSGPTYTRLWTNANPSSSFGNGNRTLSDSLQNYDALRIVWQYWSNSGVTESNWEENNYGIAYLYDIRGKIDAIVSGQRKPNIGALFYAASYTYGRRGYIVNDTTLWFSNAQRFGASGSDNDGIIPILIDGVKF